LLNVFPTVRPLRPLVGAAWFLGPGNEKMVRWILRIGLLADE